MNCAEIEILVCDYVDGTLPADRKAEVERHLAECPACAELARDSAAAVAVIASAAEVAPPPELITRILFQAPWRKNKLPSTGLRGRLTRWCSPVLQPKFAMGAAMTILSFSILHQVVPMRQLRASDLEPKAVWQGLEDRASYAWERAVKFYDNLKFVYQIQTTLREWQQQDEEQRPVRSRETGSRTDDHKLPVKSAPGGGAASPPAGGTPSSSTGRIDH
jgi:Putative zinc-finger